MVEFWDFVKHGIVFMRTYSQSSIGSPKDSPGFRSGVPGRAQTTRLERLRAVRSWRTLNNQPRPSVSNQMKKLFLSILALGVIVGSSLPARADEDRRYRDWNGGYRHEHQDRYRYENQDGYRYGHRGYWGYRHHRRTFIQVGPVTIERH